MTVFFWTEDGLVEQKEGYEDSNVVVQELGPAILSPTQTIGNVIERTNEQLAGHREWLNSLSQRDGPSKPRDAPASLITPPPFLESRQTILPECISVAAAGSSAARNFTSALIVITSASATISSLSTALSLASSSLNSAQSALISVQSSAASAVSAAQSSVNSALSSANSVQSSANSVVASASSAVNSAQASLTLAQVQASNSIAAAHASATSSIRASQVAAMNKTTLALVITFSILGSSLITLLIIFLILRYRRRRREQAELDREKLKRTIRHNGASDERLVSLSEFPMPPEKPPDELERPVIARSVGRPSSEVVPTRGNMNMMSYSDTGARDSRNFPFPGAGSGQGRQTWSASAEPPQMRGGEMQRERQRRMTESGDQRPKTAASGRTNTLTYNADFPDQPPRFGSWLGNEDGVEQKRRERIERDKRKRQRERERESEGGTEIGFAF